MHDLMDEQETLLNSSSWIGFGVGWTDQCEPFQCSAKVMRTELKPLPQPESPTAMQASGDAQETLPSSLSPPGPPKRRGCGFGSIDHLLPFQPSPSVSFAARPTAVQASREVHETLIKDPPLARSIDHVIPFQRSASGVVRSRETDCPTAVQAVGDVHDTLVSRLLSPTPTGAGTGSTDHTVPFQRSTSGTYRPGRSPEVNPPTATHEDPDGHEIPLTSTVSLPAGSAITSRDHPRPFHRTANKTSRSEEGNG
jgi:hypothetical protein